MRIIIGTLMLTNINPNCKFLSNNSFLFTLTAMIKRGKKNAPQNWRKSFLSYSVMLKLKLKRINPPARENTLDGNQPLAHVNDVCCGQLIIYSFHIHAVLWSAMIELSWSNNSIINLKPLKSDFMFKLKVYNWFDLQSCSKSWEKC